MTTSDLSQLAKLFSEIPPEQKTTVLADLARDLARNAPSGRRLPLQDSSGDLIGFLLPLTEYEPMPADETSPEFYAALLRRAAEPILTVEECLEVLKIPDRFPDA